MSQRNLASAAAAAAVNAAASAIGSTSSLTSSAPGVPTSQSATNLAFGVALDKMMNRSSSPGMPSLPNGNGQSGGLPTGGANGPGQLTVGDSTSGPIAPAIGASRGSRSSFAEKYFPGDDDDKKLRTGDTGRLTRSMDYLLRSFTRQPASRRGIVISSIIIGLLLITLVVYFSVSESFIFFLFTTMVAGLIFMVLSFWILAWIMQHDEGEVEAQDIARAIRQGSEGFYSTQYSHILRISIVIAAMLFICYAIRDPSSYPEEFRDNITPAQFASVSAVTFLVGALCSALSGYAGVWVSVRANSRVASAAHRTYREALMICFRGGAFSSIINVALAVGGLSALMLVAHLSFPTIPLLKLPIILPGFGFGASLVALFAQLGGGIYTKAADVGADLVGKVEAGIPEDDYRNPAVIADLVGDNVGDCAGQCADLFESMAAEMLAAMILGSTLATTAKLPTTTAVGFVLFPLAVHTMDLVISTIGVMLVGHWTANSIGHGQGMLLPLGSPSRQIAAVSAEAAQNPLRDMVTVYFGTCGAGAASFALLCWLFLNPASAPGAWLNFAFCGFAGIACALIFLFATQYYTDYNYSRVRQIAEASLTGPATNIIAGLAIGMESSAMPVCAISLAVVFSYHQGLTSGLAPNAPMMAGLFGTAIATMGMLCTGVYVLSMSSFGPIADNAGGIVEMTTSRSGNATVREITDRLDAVGNVTKANTKGFSVGSATLASFLLFSAFLDEVSLFVKKPFNIVDITSPDVFIGGLWGTTVIFLFSGLAMKAVGKTAAAVVDEVRRQFRERPNIMNFQELPDYRRCVSIVSDAAVKQMVLPGLLACLSPVVVGLLFKFIGQMRGDPLLGVEALGAFMMFATATGILMALFLNNGGGAWDNAKKYIETGMLGGVGSEAHKAAVVGDTVGDPCKDTAGPSVHVLIKLVATITLVLTPLFVGYSAAS